MDALTVAGRIVVLAYQSLEDRIVKRVFADAVASRTPVALPVELPGRGPRFRSLTRGAERADAAEIERNPRSTAVRLRAVQRLEHEGRSAGDREGRRMKAKRETPKRRAAVTVGAGATVPPARAGAADGLDAGAPRPAAPDSIGASREARAPNSGPQTSPDRPAGRAVDPPQKHQAGQGASQGTES